MDITYADKKQGVTVCCASVEENICNRLLAMCEEIKLPVRAITVPMEAYLRGLSQLRLMPTRRLSSCFLRTLV